MEPVFSTPKLRKFRHAYAPRRRDWGIDKYAPWLCTDQLNELFDLDHAKCIRVHLYEESPHKNALKIRLTCRNRGLYGSYYWESSESDCSDDLYDSLIDAIMESETLQKVFDKRIKNTFYVEVEIIE